MGSQLRLPAEFAEQLLQARLERGGDWGGGSCDATPTPISGSLANSVPSWLRPSPSSQREEQGEEPWYNCSAFQMHP